MSTWVLIGALTLGTVALKTMGPLLAGGFTPPQWAERVIALLLPALLTALVVTGTFGAGRTLVLEPRAAGVAAGALALVLRVTTPLALVAGAVTAAALTAVS